jgi:hypothetical protein
MRRRLRLVRQAAAAAALGFRVGADSRAAVSAVVAEAAGKGNLRPIAMGLLTLLSAGLVVATPVVDTGSALTLDTLFPDKSPFGKTARGMVWSYDDKLVSYLWNPYDDKSMDLWMYDIGTGKSKRVTDVMRMADFDP